MTPDPVDAPGGRSRNSDARAPRGFAHRDRPTRVRASRFIPRKVDLAGHTQQARLLVKFGIGFGIYCYGFVPVLLLVSAPVAALITLCCSSIMVLSPLVMRWTRSLTVGAHVLISSIVALFTGTTLLLGGLDSPTTAILVMAPILAVFLLGSRAGLFWSAFVIIEIGALFAALQTGVELPLSIQPAAIPFLKTVGFATIVGVSLVFLLQYDTSKNRALDRVKESNQRMVALIAHLNATSTALSQSAAEFLGARPDPELDPGAWSPDPRAGAATGLTQQMLLTADSSRQMIGGVGDSLRGMIDQYVDISERIHELHQQSGKIAELVDAIDNISDRLDLMALNTGIEAAHAGESGRRFQLLADDMRRLAERVMMETGRIKRSIRDVQKHTKAAIDASLAGRALTDEGTIKLEAMSRAFDDMHQLIERTAEASQRITSDTIAQLGTIHNLVSESLRQEQ